MSHPGEPSGQDGTGLGDCSCDPEKIFELADASCSPGGLDPEGEQQMREHLRSCPGCRELYERELSLNASLGSLDFPAGCCRSVSQGVAMALPTRSLKARILWGLLATVLFMVAFVCLGFSDTKPVVLTMDTLGMCWDFIAGLANMARVVLTIAAPVIILVLALGALADLLIALMILLASRYRRAREA